MSIKDFIQLVEQADIPNMKVLGQLDDGFAYIHYNGMAGVLDQQSNKMILISLKVPDSFHIVTVAGGRETTQYVGGSELGPATKKALDSITPRQRPRPPAPLPSQESYESTEQVRSIVQRMMEDARVPQKPRQGPLRPQTGAGKHKDKKKDQKQGKTKHKGKNLDENNIPFAGLGKHKIGQAGQLRSPGPTGYPKGKLVGGAAESRFGRNRDDQFSLGGRIPRTDRIDRDSSSGQDAQQRMERKLKQQTIDRLLDKGFKVDTLNDKSLPDLIQMLREAVKKPNATTRHLRDYPVSDKDVAKPVKKPEKKKPEQGVAEATGDNKFDTMMGNIKKSAPVSVTGYVAVEYASENKSDRIKGATLKGKPMPSSVDRDDLDGEIDFEPDEIERHLIKIGRDNGWSMIDPGHGRGYSELFFDTNANYTSDNQSILAKNIVNTVNQINKFFSGLNSSLQSTGLPGYRVAVWQEISSSNGQKIGDIDQIKQIALTKVVNSPNDPGELIGKAILQELPAVEQDEYDDFTPEDFAYARKIAKIYITKGERAGLEAQISNRRMDHVSDLIDELLSLSGAQKYRTLKLDDLDEQGVAEVRGNIDADQAGFYVVDDDGNAVSGPFASKQEAYERAASMGRMYDVKYKGDVIPLDSLISKIIKTLPPDVTSDDLQDPMDLEQQLETLRSPLLRVFSKLSPYEQAEVTDEVANHFYDRRFGDLDEGKQKGVDGKACWKGYKRMGTKKKGGRTVDNCVKMESISEGILKSFGLMEKSPPGFKGTVKAMKKHPELTKGKTKDGKEKNPWALAWHMKNKGYKSHKKADGSDKD